MRSFIGCLILSLILLSLSPDPVKASTVEQMFSYPASAILVGSGTGWLLCSDPASYIFNPASLSIYNAYGFGFTHVQLLDWTVYDSIYANIPLSTWFGILGAGLSNIYSGGIEFYNAAGESLGKGFYHLTSVNLAWARRIFYGLNLGVGFKLFREGGISFGRLGYTFDTGFAWRPVSNFIIGGGVRNINPLGGEGLHVYFGFFLRPLEPAFVILETEYHTGSGYFLFKGGGGFNVWKGLILHAGYFQGLNAGLSYRLRKWNFGYTLSVKSGGLLHWFTVAYLGKPILPSMVPPRFSPPLILMPLSRQLVVSTVKYEFVGKVHVPPGVAEPVPHASLPTPMRFVERIPKRKGPVVSPPVPKATQPKPSLPPEKPHIPSAPPFNLIWLLILLLVLVTALFLRQLSHTRRL